MLRSESLMLAVGLFSPICINAALVTYSLEIPSHGVTGPISFSFTSPSYITPGPFAISPFTVSIGSYTWIFTQGFAGTDCFEFGTAPATLSSCGFTAPLGQGGIGFLFLPNPTSLPPPNDLPVVDMTYNTNSIFHFNTPLPTTTYFTIGALDSEVTVTTAPEPGTVGLCLFALALWLWLTKTMKLRA